MDLQGIEPWTTPMLREYYTTKPQARVVFFDERWPKSYVLILATIILTPASIHREPSFSQ
jgi:hypothetical protein